MMYFLDVNTPLISFSNFHLLDLIAACAMIVMSGYYYNKMIKRDIKKENDVKFDKKANIAYVDQQDRSIHYRVNKLEIENDDLGKKIDKNHNFLIERIEALNNNVMKAISKK